MGSSLCIIMMQRLFFIDTKVFQRYPYNPIKRKGGYYTWQSGIKRKLSGADKGCNKHTATPYSGTLSK